MNEIKCGGVLHAFAKAQENGSPLCRSLKIGAVVKILKSLTCLGLELFGHMDWSMSKMCSFASEKV